MKQQNKRQPTVKRARRKQKSKQEADRCHPVLASEIDLRCRQFKPGTRETCKAQAVGFLPTFGDSCLGCARGRVMIRYATTRQVEVDKAA